MLGAVIDVAMLLTGRSLISLLVGFDGAERNYPVASCYDAMVHCFVWPRKRKHLCKTCLFPQSTIRLLGSLFFPSWWLKSSLVLRGGGGQLA